jgi:hypothetical protein
MDISSTLIGLGLLAVFVLPILYLIWQQNHKQKKGLKSLKDISTKNKLHTETVEISSTLMLGLDSKANKLLVVEPINNMQHRVLDLNKIGTSSVNTMPFPDNRKLIKRVSLDLFSIQDKNSPMEIIFYDDDDNENHNAAERLAVAKKWNQLISERLSA